MNRTENRTDTRSVLQVHTPGKAPPAPPQPQISLRHHNTNSWGSHTASSSKQPVKAEGYLGQLLDRISCFLTVFTVPHPFSLLPPGHKLSKMSLSLPPGAQTRGKHCRVNWKEPPQGRHKVSPTFPDANLGRGTLLH